MQAGTHTLAQNNPSVNTDQESPLLQWRDTGMWTLSVLVKLHFSDVVLQDLLEYLIAKEAKKTFDLGPDLVE